MEYYESKCLEELKMWQHQMQHNPSLINKISKALQDKINGIIPDKAHQVITVTIQKMVQACLDKFGTIDILINNVGGSAAGGPVEMSEEVFDAQINVNLKSVFLTCKYVLPTMIAKESGAIVNVASTSGIRWTGSAQVAYAATKAGVIQLSKVVAVQHAPMGIRVNTVSPGAIETI